MKNLVLSGAAMLTVASLASGAMVWDNYPAGPAAGFMSSQLDLVYPFDSQTADDFWGVSAVNHVQWNGGFWNGSPIAIPDWNILFYADAGGMPTGGPADPTGTALFHYIVSGGDVTEVGEADGSITYDVDIPDTALSAGDTYWIAIQPVFAFPPQWGISMALDSIQGSECMFGFPLLGTDYWTPGSVTFGTPRDMAFRLFPAPGAIALLGLAGLAGTRRRR